MKQFKVLYEQVLLELTFKQRWYLKRKYKCSVVDRVKVDEYELVLLTWNEPEHEKVKYCLGLDKEGTNFTTYEGQHSQVPLTKIGFKGAKIIAEALKGWIEKYDGDIIIETMKPELIKKYKRLLDRFGFNYIGYTFSNRKTENEDEMVYIIINK